MSVPLSSFYKCQSFLCSPSSPPILSHKETPCKSKEKLPIRRRRWRRTASVVRVPLFSRSEPVFHRTTAFTSAASPILNQNTTITP
ncbi:hypothetical protein HanRHA438_Chr05g0213471 [Helianthus annuus]|nr:hypothetical protein HanRHA438_Chr05g0213471 [Helianthus annuus]